MVVFNRAPGTLSVYRRLGAFLWIACLTSGAIAAVFLEAPQIIEQYTSGVE